jgi:hypothetical protein
MWSIIHPKFMPKNRVTNVSGTKIVATAASRPYRTSVTPTQPRRASGRPGAQSMSSGHGAPSGADRSKHVTTAHPGLVHGCRMPLTDGMPARRFPIVTVLLIAANLIVWIFYELPHLHSSIALHPSTPAT